VFPANSSSSTPTTVSDYVETLRTARHHRTESPKRIGLQICIEQNTTKAQGSPYLSRWIIRTALTPGTRPPTKLSTPKMGPYQVLSHEGSQYQLVNLLTGKSQKRHISLLSPYDSSRTSPIEVAAAGQITIWSTESYPTPANLQGIRQCGFVPAGWATAPTMIRNNRMQASRTISCSTNIAVSKTHKLIGCLQRRHSIPEFKAE
jgi:hypothetical protein